MRVITLIPFQEGIAVIGENMRYDNITKGEL